VESNEILLLRLNVDATGYGVARARLHRSRSARPESSAEATWRIAATLSRESWVMRSWTAMPRDALLSSFRPPPRRTVRHLGEVVLFFLVGHPRWICELRNHGPWGIEAMPSKESLRLQRRHHPNASRKETPCIVC
jgi:hypothetical protein